MKTKFYIFTIFVFCFVFLNIFAAPKKETRAQIQETIACYTRDILKDTVKTLQDCAQDQQIFTHKKIFTKTVLCITHTQEILIHILEELIDGESNNCLAQISRTELLKLRSILHEKSTQKTDDKNAQWWQKLTDEINGILQITL